MLFHDDANPVNTSLTLPTLLIFTSLGLPFWVDIKASDQISRPHVQIANCISPTMATITSSASDQALRDVLDSADHHPDNPDAPAPAAGGGCADANGDGTAALHGKLVLRACMWLRGVSVGPSQLQMLLVTSHRPACQL